jgi:FixJ family two-component response regulator
VNNSRRSGLASGDGDANEFHRIGRGRRHASTRDLADLLKDHGLEVIECTTAEAAELVVASTGAELKALVTDVSLAGEMSGTELAQFAKRRFPNINVVVLSDRPPTYIPQEASFLLKPYQSKELLEAVLR